MPEYILDYEIDYFEIFFIEGFDDEDIVQDKFILDDDDLGIKEIKKNI